MLYPPLSLAALPCPVVSSRLNLVCIYTHIWFGHVCSSSKLLQSAAIPVDIVQEEQEENQAARGTK